jgi:hypothetical protein
VVDVVHLDIAHLIQSAVAPVFLISGVAATLSVLTGRLARAVDRARALEEKLERGSGGAPGVDLRHIPDELGVLARRAGYINAAISLCAISAVLTTLVVITLFANAFFDVHMALAIAVLFAGALLSLTTAFLAFLIEVRVATNALRIGIRAHRERPASQLASGRKIG